MQVEIIQGNHSSVKKRTNEFLLKLKDEGMMVIKQDLAMGSRSASGQSYSDTPLHICVMITYATKDEIREMKLSTILDDNIL